MELQWPDRFSLMLQSPTCSALDPLQSGFVPWSTFVPNWQGPCTHKDGSWSHHLIEDAEDPADGAEDLGDGVEAFVDDAEALGGLEKH